MADRQQVLGIVGGSGVYGIEGLSNTRWQRIASPFGEASDELLFGELDGQPLVFLPRHGRGHVIPPSEINFRANIDALKRAGVTDVLSVSAVGSLREALRMIHATGRDNARTPISRAGPETAQGPSSLASRSAKAGAPIQKPRRKPAKPKNFPNDLRTSTRPSTV